MVLRFHAVRVRIARVALALLAAIATVFPVSPLSAQDLARLTGVWEGTEFTLLGRSAVEAIFFPNGTYSRAHVLGALMTRDAGRFEVVGNWVHFYLESWAPTEYLGRPLNWPTSDTWIVTEYDGRTLETEAIHLERVR